MIVLLVFNYLLLVLKIFCVLNFRTLWQVQKFLMMKISLIPVPIIHLRGLVCPLCVSQTMPMYNCPCVALSPCVQAAVDSVAGFGSSWSLADGDGYLKGDYDISGEVLFGVEYKKEVLSIIVKQARGLAPADKNGFSTP